MRPDHRASELQSARMLSIIQYRRLSHTRAQNDFVRYVVDNFFIYQMSKSESTFSLQTNFQVWNRRMTKQYISGEAQIFRTRCFLHTCIHFAFGLSVRKATIPIPMSGVFRALFVCKITTRTSEASSRFWKGAPKSRCLSFCVMYIVYVYLPVCMCRADVRPFMERLEQTSLNR